MRKISFFIAVGFLQTGLLWADAFPSVSITPAWYSISIPVESIEVGDLDARDEFNRPIQSQQIQNDFKQLFSRSLNRMLLLNLTPARVAFLDRLELISDRWASWLRRHADRFYRQLVYWTQKEKSRGFSIFDQSTSLVINQVQSKNLHHANFKFLSHLALILASVVLLR